MEARLRMLSKLNWIQTIGLGLVSGLLWFQIPRKESSIPDIRGWVSLPFLILKVPIIKTKLIFIRSVF